MIPILNVPVRRVLLGLAASALVIAAALVLQADVALAQVVTDGDASPDTPAGAVFTINNGLVYLITAGFLPFIIGLVQRDSNPGWVKVGLAGAVSTVATAFLELVQDDGSAIISQEFLLKAVVTFAGAVFAYNQVWRPIAGGTFNGNRVLPWPFPHAVDATSRRVG